MEVDVCVLRAEKRVHTVVVRREEKCVEFVIVAVGACIFLIVAVAVRACADLVVAVAVHAFVDVVVAVAVFVFVASVRSCLGCAFFGFAVGGGRSHYAAAGPTVVADVHHLGYNVIAAAVLDSTELFFASLFGATNTCWWWLYDCCRRTDT